MIAYYNEQYFNISLKEKPFRLWRYDFVEEFTKKVKPDGLIVYEKYVLPEEIDEIIDIDFSVKWNNEWCGASYSARKNIVGITSGDKEFAEKYHLATIERGVYASAIPIEECQEFRMYTRNLGSEERTYTTLTMEEFKLQWKLTQQDLIPPR